MSNNREDRDQIKELFFLCLKNWYYFVISFFICGILGVIYIKTATPVWKVSAQLSLRQDESLMGGAGISKAQSLMSTFGLGGGGSESVEDETSKLSSQGHLKTVVKNLGLNTKYTQKNNLFFKTSLFDQSPIVLITDPAMADTLSTVINFSLDIKPNKINVKMKAGKETVGKFDFTTLPATLKTEWGDYTLDYSPFYNKYEYPMKLKILYSSYDFMAQEYQKELFADYEKKTSLLINLAFESENTHFAKAVLNEVINVYNKEWVNDKELVAEKTVRYIDSRLASTLNRLSDADLEIQKFKNKYNLTELEADVAYYLKATSELQLQVLQAETQLNIADIVVNFVKDENNKYSPIPYDAALSEPNMSQAITKYNEELARRNELYKGDTQSALAISLDNQIEIQRKNLLISLDNIKKGLLITLDNVKRKEKEYSSKVGNVPTIEKEYVTLRREQEIQQEIYLLLLQMREQSALKGVNILPKLRVINAPYVVNKKASPKKLNVALAIFMGAMAVSFSLMYGVPYFRSKKRKNK